MFPLLPPSSAFYENSQDEYPADGPHNVSSRTMTARTVTTDGARFSMLEADPMKLTYY